MEDLLHIQDKVRQFIIKTSYSEDEQVKNDTLIFEQGMMDSMAFMSLIAFIEETFSIQLNDNELIEAHFESIDAISVFIKEKLNHH